MKIRGNTVGTPMAIPDWDQDNPLRANYIKNKPKNRLLPVVTEEDNGKVAQVEGGKWVKKELSISPGGGTPGENGATFTPSVSSSGVISWTNDKGLNNPTPVNIKGDPYTLTDTDKQSIAEEVYSMIADGNGVAY